MASAGSSSTIAIVAAASSSAPRTTRLHLRPRDKKAITWNDAVVDNEDMGKRKSKKVLHLPQAASFWRVVVVRRGRKAAPMRAIPSEASPLALLAMRRATPASDEKCHRIAPASRHDSDCCDETHSHPLKEHDEMLPTSVPIVLLLLRRCLPSRRH